MFPLPNMEAFGQTGTWESLVARFGSPGLTPSAFRMRLVSGWKAEAALQTAWKPSVQPPEISESKGKKRGGKYTQYRGVNWDRHRKMWEARITQNGQKKRLGRFCTALEAAHAYDIAAIKMLGPEAKLNVR